MEDISKLPHWGSDVDGGAEDATPKDKVRFPYKPEFNERIVLTTTEKMLNLECDVIVVATNETFDAKNCIHEEILEKCGPEFTKTTHNLPRLRVTETRLLPIPSGTIGAKNIMMMIPPRFSQKYYSAAVNSLNKTYLNALQACVDNAYHTVIFTAVHDLEHKFDANIAAEVVVRTIRRFFEHYPTNMDKICLCLDTSGLEAYTKQMKLYFPRTAEEAAAAEKSLPADVGNEWGEIVVAARSIRISSLPGMGGDDDDDYSDEDDQIPEVVGEQPSSLEYSQRQPNPDVRSTQGVNDPRSPNYIPEGYVNGILARAATMDFSELEQAGFFINCGLDNLSQRNLLMFIGANYAKVSSARDKVMPFLAKTLDSVSFSPFTIVYVHCSQTNNADSMSWIHSIAATFPRRCLVNMRLAVLYPTFWLKTHLRINRLGGLRPISDISYYDNLAALFRVVGRDAVRLPEDIIRADPSVQTTSSAAASSTAASKPSAESAEDDAL